MGVSSEEVVVIGLGEGVGVVDCASCLFKSASCFCCSDSAIRMSFASRFVRGMVCPVNFAEYS